VRFVQPGCTNLRLRVLTDAPQGRLSPKSEMGPLPMRGFLRICPSPHIRFLFALCQAPSLSLSGRIALADDLLVRCLAHRARTALRPSSLLCSGVSLENRTFPPLRPPSLPSATACGFFAFFFAIRYSLSQIARKKNLSCLYLTAMV